MNEPLKNKLWCLRHPDRSRMTKCKWVANEDSIKSAVEWLIEEDLKVHLDFERKEINYLTLVQRLGNNRNKAFEDVTNRRKSEVKDGKV